MIRARLGLVEMGAGGNAADYRFVDGLSRDARLAPYLQDLSVAQLQGALDGQAPSIEDMIGTDPVILASCSNPAQYDPAICGPGGPRAKNPLFMNAFSESLGLANIPTWGWIAGGSLIALAVLGGRD